ncbi:hypothetical protein J5Y09_06745 [Roseomonas sp. PWR1]|uniref:Replication protein n=1 Tax=Roseomonas nitratireducens TaxID=2820810 RepID=A0ABS4ARY2_9PROT|nr:hypothetical protein [Neoroseomonas nitratireducens]MBP0463601.1 hypothetical protein [Neoroseomonas nitratireducens]
MSHIEPISRRDAGGKRALAAYRDAQDAPLTLAQFAVLSVRIRFMDLEAPGITWTAPDVMHECSHIKDAKTIRKADRALIDMGIMSLDEEAGFYRVARYRLHLDRLAALAAERRMAFEAAKGTKARPGRKAKLTGATPRPIAEIDRGIFPNWQGLRPYELPTATADVRPSVSATHNAAPAARRRGRDEGQQDSPPARKAGGVPKQWACHRTGFKVPREVTPTTWAAALARMAPEGKPVKAPAVRSWLSDLNSTIRAGRDPNRVALNAIRCGLPRPNADRFPGWKETLDQQPPQAIAGTLAFRFGAFDQEVDLLAKAVASLLEEGHDLEAIECIAAEVQKAADAADAVVDQGRAAVLWHSVRHHYRRSEQRAEAFQTAQEVGFDTKGRFHPDHRPMAV